VFRKAGGQGVEEMKGAVFAVDVSRNWEHATIAVANSKDGKQQTELVQTFVNPTEDQIFTRLTELFAEHAPRAIALDDRQLTNIGKRLKSVGIPTWQLWTKEVTAACSAVYALFSTEMVTHNNDPLLIMQSPNGVTKYTGENWLISRKESLGEIDALLATIFALYVSSRAQHAQIGVF
jgi:phage terminase large subunit-like protein